MTEESPGRDGPTEPSVGHRYDRLSLGDDGVIVYDRDRVDAWIHSSVAYELRTGGPTPEAREAELEGDDAGSGGE